MADTYSWIGSSGGSWGTGSNWADVTTSTSPAGTAPSGLNAAIVNGPAGSAEVIAGGGAAASLTTSGLVDLSGTYDVGGLLAAGNTYTDSLGLDTGARLAAGAIAINQGTMTVTGAALTTAGSLTIGTASSSTSANGFLVIGSAGSLTAAGPARVANGTLSLSGPGAVANLGSLTVGTISASSIYYYGGLVAIANGATLTAGNITEAYGGISATDTGSRLLSTGTVTLLNYPYNSLDIASGAAFQAAGLVFQQFDASTFIASFSLDSSSTAEIGTLGGGNAGTLSVDAGATILAGSNANIFAPTILDNGVIAVTGGTLTLAGANTSPATSGTIAGNGTLLIGADGLLQLDGTVASTDTVSFAGTAAALEIGQGSTFSQVTFNTVYTGLYPENAAITGFAIGDSITFDNTVLTAATYVATGTGVGTLDLMDGITQVASLTLDGTYTGDNFFIGPATNGGSSVSILAPGASGTSPVSTTTDTYSWIGSSGGSWGSGSNWADVTTSASPAGTAPGGLNAVVVNGPTGPAYDVVTSGGSAASLLLTGLVDLSGTYDIGGMVTVGTAAADSLDLGTGAALAAGAIAINTGMVTETGAALTTGGSLTIGTETSLASTNGLLAIDAGARLAVGGNVLLTAGTLWVSGSGAIAHLGSLTVGITSPSSIVAPGEAVIIDNGATLTAGNVTEAYGGTSGSPAFGISTNYSGINVTGVGSRLLSTGTVTLLSSYSTNTLNVSGGAAFQTAGLMVLPSGTNLNTASFVLDSLSTAEIGTLGTVNAGTLTVDAGATILAGSNARITAPTILDNGVIAVTDGTLTLAGISSATGGTIEGTGSLSIGANGLLQLDGTVASTDTIRFTGTAAALEIGQGSTFSLNTFSYINTGLYPENAAITGFAIGDSITFDNTSLTAATYVATGTGVGTLDLMNGITQVASLTLDGTYTGDNFVISPATNGGSSVSILAPGALCFLPGTLIRTPDGQTEVERLSAGDRVLTARGQTRPIVWVGSGQVLATRGQRNAATPVIVRKGALAPNVPHTDLRVTKGHSFFIDNVLIPVEFLVNHRSILWDDRAQEVTVYHIELESHDVLLANGAAAESYRDDGNRWLFQNANSGWDQPPKPPFAPVLTGGPIVDAVWRQLLDRAGGRPGLPLTAEADLHLVVDGLRVDAAVRTNDVLVFDIARPAGQVRIVSRAAAPQELGVARDPRCLGVALRGIAIRQGTRFRTLSIDAPGLTDGFHACEPGLRWTDGDAVLPAAAFDGFDEGCEVMLRIGGRTLYIDDGRIEAVA